VLAQCPALVHLDLSENRIGDGEAERLSGVLAQCPALVYLNLFPRNLVKEVTTTSQYE